MNRGLEACSLTSILSRISGRSGKGVSAGGRTMNPDPPRLLSYPATNAPPPGFALAGMAGPKPASFGQARRTTPPTSGRPSHRVSAVHPCRGAYPPGRSPRQIWQGTNELVPEIWKAGGGNFRLPSPAVKLAAAPHSDERHTPNDRKPEKSEREITHARWREADRRTPTCSRIWLDQSHEGRAVRAGMTDGEKSISNCRRTPCSSGS